MQLGGIYRGYVLRVDDPTKSGRVKVWVPSVHGTNLNFHNVDSPEYIGGLNNDEVEDLKEKLPWAPVGQSLFGGGGSAYDSGGALIVGDGTPFSGGSLESDSKGYVNPDHLREFLINDIKSSSLVGNKPADADRYNIDGSAESWANFMVTLCQKESSFRTGTKGDIGRFNGGSNGLFQLSPDDAVNYKFQKVPYTIEQLQDPTLNTRVTLKIMMSLLRQHNIINGGSKQGLSRYWGPIRRNEINPSPVPPYTPSVSTPTNVPTGTSNIDEYDTNVSTQTQKPAAAFSSEGGNFRVSHKTRDQLGGNNKTRQMGRPISLDFNAAGGNAGVMIIIPDDATSTERALALKYVQETANFMARYSSDPKSQKINSRPIRTRSSNGRGLYGFYHTEGWDTDEAAMRAVMAHPEEYAAILAGTLGQIPNAFFLPPHLTNGNAGTWLLGYSERDFAKKYICPYLDSSGGQALGDAFVSVGNVHPEETRDTQFLTSIGVQQDKIDEIVQNGKDLYELTSKAKHDNSGKYTEEIQSLREARTTLWEDLELGEEESTKRSKYISTHEMDYSDIPVNTHANPAGTSYGHSVYNNVSKGSYTVPNNGAPVWVMFEGGNIEDPVVIAHNPSTKDYAGIYNTGGSPDYPQDASLDNTTRGKHVVSSRGGTVEMVDTTGRERMKLTSYHGSSYSMDQLGTQELVVGGKSKLVQGDSFCTVRGNDSIHTDGDNECITMGDRVIKCGNVRSVVEVQQRMKELYSPIHDKARSFPITRAESGHPRDSSPTQTKSGTHAPCPTCSGNHTFTTRTSEPSTWLSGDTEGSGNQADIDVGDTAVEQRHEDPSTCVDCGGTGLSKSSAEGNFDLDPQKKEIQNDINSTTQEMTELENQLGSGGNQTEYYAKSRTIFVGGDMNDLDSIRVDPIGKQVISGQQPSPSGKAVTPLHRQVPHVETVSTSSLAGGDYSMMVANKYNLLVGANGINMKTLGEYNIQGRILTVAGDQVIISSNNQVTIDGGVNINLVADSISMSPRNQNIDGTDYKSLALDGNIGVSSNMVIKGGTHVEGELSTQHITAPKEWQQTEETISHSKMIANKKIGYVEFPSDPVAKVKYDIFSVECEDATVSLHSHVFPNAPMTLLETNDDVRAAAAPMAAAAPVLAEPIQHTKTTNKTLAAIRYFDPNLFALFKDCNEDDERTNQIIDDLFEGNITKEEATELFTRASESALSVSEIGCDPCV